MLKYASSSNVKNSASLGREEPVERTLSRVLYTIGCVAVLVVLNPSAAHADDGSYIDAIMAGMDGAMVVCEGPRVACTEGIN